MLLVYHHTWKNSKGRAAEMASPPTSGDSLGTPSSPSLQPAPPGCDQFAGLAQPLWPHLLPFCSAFPQFCAWLPPSQSSGFS